MNVRCMGVYDSFKYFSSVVGTGDYLRQSQQFLRQNSSDISHPICSRHNVYGQNMPKEINYKLEKLTDVPTI